MPLEWSEFDDKDGDTRVGVDIGGVFANSDDEELFFIVVVVCAFTPNPEILVRGTSLGKGEEPFTLDELRKLAGDDDFPYDSDILFCTDEESSLVSATTRTRRRNRWSRRNSYFFPSRCCFS